MNKILIAALIILTSSLGHAKNSFYCPQNHGYIKEGMSESQVLQACGKPTNKSSSKQPASRNIKVTSLVFNNVGSKNALRNGFSVTFGNEGGTSLSVNIVDNKVSDMLVDGQTSTSTNICSGANIQVGDNATKVISSCGSPSVTNTSVRQVFLNGQQEVTNWSYVGNRAQPNFSLTFVNGKLQSINN